MPPPSRVALCLRALLLGAPLLIPLALPPERLPAGVAYAVSCGRWLAIAGIVAAAVAVLRGGRAVQPALPFSAAASRIGRAPAWLAVPVIVACGWLLIPGERWGATRFSGDEPKYVRMARSLHSDLDVDMSSRWSGEVTPARWGRNLRWLALTARDTAVDLASGASPGPESREWNLGNWRIEGWRGGRYFVHAPGLPLLLLPSMLLQDALAPHLPFSLFPQATLLLLWALCAHQAVRLAVEVSGSPAAGALAGLATALSAPLFLLSFHFYPEVAVAAAVPWAFRKLRGAAPPLRPGAALAVALAAGGLPWLHTKFTAVSAALVLLLGLKLWGRPRALAGALSLGIVPFAAFLLFNYRVTGLLRPDALYVRYASEVYGGLGSFLTLRFLRGLAIGLFGALDGLLVMAPVAIAACFSLSVAWRRSRRDVLELGLVFGSLLAAAAVHGGGAPGTPGRLVAPVAVLLAGPLAVGLAERGAHLPYRWSVAALVLVTGAITWTMLEDWRRPVKPYREMFPTAAVDFSRDIPGGPDVRQSERARVVRDLAGSGVLALGIGFWAWWWGRPRRPDPAPDTEPVWRRVRDVHLGWWATLIALSSALAAISP
jgi:hypothetical protein